MGGLNEKRCKTAHFVCLIKWLSVTNLEEKMAQSAILILRLFKCASNKCVGFPHYDPILVKGK